MTDEMKVALQEVCDEMLSWPKWYCRLRFWWIGVSMSKATKEMWGNLLHGWPGLEK